MIGICILSDKTNNSFIENNFYNDINKNAVQQ